MIDYIPRHDWAEEYTPEEIEQLRSVVGRVRGVQSARYMPLAELIERGHPCDMAEEDAVRAVQGMIDTCRDLIKALTDPDEQHDERKPFSYQGRLGHDYERVVIELANLADVRNTHKIQR